MKVHELKRILERIDDYEQVMVLIKLPYSTVGSRPMVPVKFANSGFDFEAGKFIIIPDEDLTPSDRDFAKQMREMQDRAGWADYENRGLKSEIKLLKKQIEELKNVKIS
jgi:hypothetical protein